MNMTPDSRPQTTNHVSEASTQRRKIPVFILILVGIFLAAMIFYMLSDREPKPGQIPADTSIPATQADGSNNTATATAVEDTARHDNNTATATDH